MIHQRTVLDALKANHSDAKLTKGLNSELLGALLEQFITVICSGRSESIKWTLSFGIRPVSG